MMNTPAVITQDYVRLRPFFKWVGGKRQLLPILEQHVPKDFKDYHEPFLGGGALFWHLVDQGLLRYVAYLADTNAALINTWDEVQRHPHDVVSVLRDLAKKTTADDYYAIRAQYNSEFITLDARAAHFLYLNKVGFNGLYRVNAKGVFNVPYGKTSLGNPAVVCDARYEALLHACSSAMTNRVALDVLDFDLSLSRVRRGDFVYCDPPYIPMNATSFTQYCTVGFDAEMQERLVCAAASARDMGAYVLLSNSDTPLTRALYRGWNLIEVQARRLVNSDAQGRGPVGELLIKGW